MYVWNFWWNWKKQIILDFNEQVNNLKEKNLTINENKEELIDFLKIYGYERIINYYSKPFCEDFQKIKNYRNGVDSNAILKFIEFENEILYFILKILHELEMKFATIIAYEILQNFKNNNILRNSLISKDNNLKKWNLVNWRN